MHPYAEDAEIAIMARLYRRIWIGEPWNVSVNTMVQICRYGALATV